MWFSILFLVIRVFGNQSVVLHPTADPTLRETGNPSKDVSSENEIEMSLTEFFLHVITAAYT